MKYLCIWLIRFYQRFLSPLKRSPTCRFQPSCSAYAVEAFQKRGFFVGMLLTVWRILRCNPFCVGGYDPVPEHGFPHREKRKKTAASLSDTGGDKNDSAPQDTSRKAMPPRVCQDYEQRLPYRTFLSDRAGPSNSENEE